MIFNFTYLTSETDVKYIGLGFNSVESVAYVEIDTPAGRVSTAFTQKKPGQAWTSKKPGQTWTSKKPDITF